MYGNRTEGTSPLFFNVAFSAAPRMLPWSLYHGYDLALTVLGIEQVIGGPKKKALGLAVAG